MTKSIVHTTPLANGSIRFNETLAKAITIIKHDDAVCYGISLNRFPVSHELIDKVIRHKETRIMYVVSRVYMMYDDGYYVVALYDQNTGSSGQVNLMNISCPHSYAEPQIAEYEIVDVSLDDFFGVEPREWYVKRKSTVARHIANYAGIAKIICV